MRKLILCLLVGFSYADGVSALNQFMQANKTISANFSQIIFGHKKNRISTGIMEISRPNKFRWQYDKEGGNIGQLIISDGKDVYIVDDELDQVTKKKLGQTLDRSPAMLLSGSSDIQKIYNITKGTEVNGIEWVSLTPQTADDNNGFQVVEIGFNSQTQKLEQMKFTDNFGNKSQINFSNVKEGITFKSNEFKYIKPKDYDLVDGN